MGNLFIAIAIVFCALFAVDYFINDGAGMHAASACVEEAR
jgi:hypothetical protein